MGALSIIVVNWNGVELLPGCLDPLVGSDHEVIVVDNASSDGSVALLRAAYPWLRVVVNEENRGFAVANNQGLALARCEYALLLNNDTIPNWSALDVVSTFLDDHPRAGIAGPSISNVDGSRQESCGPGPNLWTEFLSKTMLHRLAPGLRSRAPQSTQRVSWVTGAALFVRRSIVEDLGGLDEEMFMFYEDLDFCARVREHGWEVWFVPTEPIVHIGGASRRKVEAQSLVHSHRSSIRFFRRHGPAWRRVVITGMTIPEVALRGLLWSMMWLVPSQRPLASERLRAYRTILRIVIGRDPA